MSRSVTVLLRVRHGSAAVLGCWLLAGCSTSLGAKFQSRLQDDHSLRYGVELSEQIQPFGNRALALRGSIAYFPRTGGACCHEVRVKPELGYVVLPLPEQSRVGVEVMGGASLGNVEVEGDGHFGLGPAVEIGVPLRLSPTRELWEQQTLEYVWLLVPSLGEETLFPAGSVGHRPVIAFEASLNLRLAAWHQILP